MQRVMVFIDGENLCIRGQELLSNSEVLLSDGRLHTKDAFLWFEHRNIYYTLPKTLPAPILNSINEPEAINVIRSTYYTSICGDTDKIRELEEKIWNVGLHPAVFKKTRREEKAKGVDIALTKDMLVHSFSDNYDIAVLVAGDGDYIPLIEEVKHEGKRVILQFINVGLNPRLKIACDAYTDITANLQQYWLSQRPSQQK